ncbi:VanZ family protein [Gammaproteobacteria bacterium]|nr:VanZ family protein [Gammaproteobacteria bacterium]
MKSLPVFKFGMIGGWRVSLGFAMVVVYGLSLVPVPPHGPRHVDKIEHLVVFAVLALIALRALPSWRGRYVLVMLAAFGLFIELSQTLLAWRSGSLADWLADCVGAALAIVIDRCRRQPQ